MAQSEFVPQWSERWRVSTEAVEALVDTGEASLLDARPSNFFEGGFWTIARASTIRGAEPVDPFAVPPVACEAKVLFFPAPPYWQRRATPSGR